MATGQSSLSGCAANDLSVVEQAVAVERERICCRLHDTTLQMLELIASGALAEEDADPRRLMGLAAMAAEDLRGFIDGESGALGFEDGLRSVVAEARLLASHRIELRLGACSGDIGAEALAEALSAVREALTNARKHARSEERRVGQECRSRW